MIADNTLDRSIEILAKCNNCGYLHRTPGEGCYYAKKRGAYTAGELKVASRVEEQIKQLRSQLDDVTGQLTDVILREEQLRAFAGEYGGHKAECVIVRWGLRVPEQSQPKCDCGYKQKVKELGF